MSLTDTIVALATPAGTGAIGIIRLSGPEAISIAASVFKGKDLTKQASHTLHFGKITDENILIDEVLASIFVAPHSYTKENSVEFSCHGSAYIIAQIIKLLISKGARMAKAGEFTMRAFLNGQLDLSQAEAVADLIASQNAASHQIAMNQMRGGFSSELQALRSELINFASLVELELDFSEEDVEFANRAQMKNLILQILKVITRLINSFELGNVIKNGIPVVIAGKPNVGKSTLLNALLNEERAIVSEIAGTTRDTIEDEMSIQGLRFRFIDTAGIRETDDVIEAKGVARSMEKINSSAVILYVYNASQTSLSELQTIISEFKPILEKNNSTLFLVENKSDKNTTAPYEIEGLRHIQISALLKTGMQKLENELVKLVDIAALESGQSIVSNLRHAEALQNAATALEKVLNGIDNPITSDFLAMDIKQALQHLGEITGSISTDDLLDNIFSKFCIGK
jgi:tRNA modification GTPase